MEYVILKISKTGHEFYLVPSREGYRLVSLDPLYCSCPDFISRVLLQKKKKQCKHISLILEQVEMKSKRENIQLQIDAFVKYIRSKEFLEEGIITIEKE